MPDGEIAGQVGRLLQGARARARMTQARLAQRAGSSQQWVSRVERGAVDLRLSDAERLFEAARVRLVVRTAGRTDEPVADPDLLTGVDGGGDASAAALGGALVEELAAFRHVLRVFGSVPYVVAGRFAALAQGVPVRPYRLDLVVAECDTDAATQALALLSALRWSDRLQDFLSFDIDVGRPGERRWRIAGLTELAIDVVPELPAALMVGVEERLLPVVPLTVLLRDDPDVAELHTRCAT